MTTEQTKTISTVIKELEAMIAHESLDPGVERHIWNQMQALKELIEPDQIQQKAYDLAGKNGELHIPKPNTITIHQTGRGYSVEFPHKPNPNAIKGFHSLGMIWRSAGLNDRVTWFIPAGKIKDAVEFIEYWYSAKAAPNHPNYSVEVIAA